MSAENTQIKVILEPNRLNGVCNRGAWFALRDAVYEYAARNDLHVVTEAECIEVTTCDPDEVLAILALVRLANGP